MKSTPRGSWHLVALALVAVAVVLAAVLEVGAPASSARVSRELVTAENGVIQSSVSGSGNIEPGTEAFANFKTSGTLSTVYVSVGEHVQQGRLLATLDPTSAQLSVDQAQLSLDAAQDELAAAEDGASSSSSSGNASNASTTVDPSTTEFVSEDVRRAGAPVNTPVTNTTNTNSTHSRSTGARQSSSSHQSASADDSHAPSSSGSSSHSNTTTTTPSPAAIASAQAQVDSAELNLRDAQTTLAETRLYAPATGTIVSLESTSPGDQISSGSNSSSSGSSTSGSGSSGSGSSGAGGSSSSAAGSLGGSSSSSSSSGSGFAEIVNTDAMTMTVALSESDISKVKVGQQATVTLDALTGVELAAHVSSIAVLGTDSDGVVSYDVTLSLDQSDSQVRPGMSASAAIVTQQAQGVNLPNSAVSGGGSLSTVDLLKNGKNVPTPVVVGLKGDSRTQIVSGLRAGQQVVVTTTLPSLSSSAASSSSGTLGGLRARFGGGLGGAGAFGGGGGLGAARLFGGG
jgi:multidrug efflux pump subunit AcrA (membrane-fusion protein)